MSDLEAALAAHLNGKFFWEPTNNRDRVDESQYALEIQKAQRAFSKGAKHITSRTKEIEKLPDKKLERIVLNGEKKKIEKVLNAISYAYGLSPEELLSKSTSPRYSKAKRHLYWDIYKNVPGMSFERIGNLLDKDHSTIMHGVKEFQAKQDFEKVVEVDRLMGRI